MKQEMEVARKVQSSTEVGFFKALQTFFKFRTARNLKDGEFLGPRCVRHGCAECMRSIEHASSLQTCKPRAGPGAATARRVMDKVIVAFLIATLYYGTGHKTHGTNGIANTAAVLFM